MASSEPTGFLDLIQDLGKALKEDQHTPSFCGLGLSLNRNYGNLIEVAPLVPQKKENLF